MDFVDSHPQCLFNYDKKSHNNKYPSCPPVINHLLLHPLTSIPGTSENANILADATVLGVVRRGNEECGNKQKKREAMG